jgi:putative ABC transport system substrate-binding protein
LLLYAEDDPEGQLRANAFRAEIERLNWVPDRNLDLVLRWGTFDSEWASAVNAELLRSLPDVLVVNGTAALRATLAIARTVPTVFIAISEPVAQGYVASLARPGGNLTGFSNLEPTFGPKWLEILKEIAPSVTHAAFLYHPANPGNAMQAELVMMAAQKFSLQVTDAKVRELAEIEAAITAVACEPGGALVLPPDPIIAGHRKRIVEMATQNRLPVVSALRSFVEEGGLLSYGVHIPDQFRQAATYADRILRGEKPADLPVQQPVKFEMVINMKTAKALGLIVPLTLQVAADEVIE